MWKVWGAVSVIAAVSLSGCGTDPVVVFVTKTSIGIDADSTASTAAIAYERIDGYYAPRYPDGEVPPVVSSIQTDLSIFAPQVSQTYATGNAALILAAKKGTQVATCPKPKMIINTKDKSQDKKRMFFGTATTLGFKVSFSAAGSPDAIVLGFKRKEASVIPVGIKTDSDGVETSTYPSVLANIQMRV